MTVDIDILLNTDLLAVPEDFSRRVMAEVGLQPAPGTASGGRERLQWLALLAAGGLGLSQLLAFIFGVWAASAAL